MLFSQHLFEIITDRDKKNIELIKKKVEKNVITKKYGIDIALFIKQKLLD